MQIPQSATEIIETLNSHGYEAYIVGGCVRDSILKREPMDWDITTSARPDEVKKLFRRTVDTGIEHGTVTVLSKGDGYEVTTYRTDGKYDDHRHPKEVEFAPTLDEDLKRRDFTINAMAYNPAEGLIDLYDGQKDLKSRIVRCVGNPYERFEEDALRMLRGVRFAGQLEFDIESETKNAIADKADTLKFVSAERIRVELVKLLISNGADRLRLAYTTGLTKVFLPEFDKAMETVQNNPHHMYTVGEHTIHVIMEVNRLVQSLPADDPMKNDKTASQLSLAALLHDIAKPECRTTDEAGTDHFHGHDVKGAEMAKSIMRRLKFDNDTIRVVAVLVKYHDRRYKYLTDEAGNYSSKGKKAFRRLVSEAGADIMPLLFILQEADILGQSEYKCEEKLRLLEYGKKCFEEIVADGDALKISDLAIGGSDLIKQKGFKPGPDIGAELKRLLEKVIEEPSLNERKKLLELVDEK